MIPFNVIFFEFNKQTPTVHIVSVLVVELQKNYRI